MGEYHLETSTIYLNLHEADAILARLRKRTGTWAERSARAKVADCAWYLRQRAQNRSAPQPRGEGGE